jgi:inositol transport system ATP-binding protein
VTEEYILEMRNITKVFPGVKALDNVDLQVHKATVHALMGENGAGKSTLMNILIGNYPPDAGTVIFKNERIRTFKIHHALTHGIAMIHQELLSVPTLTVAQNIFLGRERLWRGSPFVNSREMVAASEELFHRLNIALDPNRRMKTLSIAETQLLEIAKAISYNADLLIMDEPTSAITENEVAHLFEIIRALKQTGVSVIYITHKMDEVFHLCDEVTVLRDGVCVGTGPIASLSRDRLISMMVGRELTALFSKEEVTAGKEVLSVQKLSRKGEFENVSFTLHKGEILGVAGLMGAGRTEIMETIFGIRRPDSGTIQIHGRRARINSPRDAIKHRMAMVTEDRKLTGLFLVLSVLENIVLAAIRGVFLRQKELADAAGRQIAALNIKTPSRSQIIKNLSGGNQQKVFISRWLLTAPEILILDEPTRGIDVGAKAEIHRIMSTLVSQGTSIIMISSELPEILGMSDRIIVIHEGRISGEFDRGEATQEKLLKYAAGN